LVFLKLFQSPSGLAVNTLIDKLDALRDGIIDEPTAPFAPQSGSPDSTVSEASETALPKSETAGLEEDQSPTVSLEPREEVAQDREHLWDRLIKRVTREKPSLAALLKKCNLTLNTDSQFEIEVRGNDFSLKSIKRHHKMLEKLCCELVGQSVSLNLNSNIEDAATKKKKKKKTAQLEQKALSHPLVMEALKLFDGKVVDVNIP
jgi:DNA polymerase-3 subunit gamma/tau